MRILKIILFIVIGIIGGLIVIFPIYFFTKKDYLANRLLHSEILFSAYETNSCEGIVSNEANVYEKFAKYEHCEIVNLKYDNYVIVSNNGKVALFDTSMKKIIKFGKYDSIESYGNMIKSSKVVEGTEVFYLMNYKGEIIKQLASTEEAYITTSNSSMTISSLNGNKSLYNYEGELIRQTGNIDYPTMDNAKKFLSFPYGGIFYVYNEHGDQILELTNKISKISSYEIDDKIVLVASDTSYVTLEGQIIMTINGCEKITYENFEYKCGFDDIDSSGNVIANKLLLDQTLKVFQTTSTNYILYNENIGVIDVYYNDVLVKQYNYIKNVELLVDDIYRLVVSDDFCNETFICNGNVILLKSSGDFILNTLYADVVLSNIANKKFLVSFFEEEELYYAITDYNLNFISNEFTGLNLGGINNIKTYYEATSECILFNVYTNNNSILNLKELNYISDNVIEGVKSDGSYMYYDLRNDFLIYEGEKLVTYNLNDLDLLVKFNSSGTELYNLSTNEVLLSFNGILENVELFEYGYKIYLNDKIVLYNFSLEFIIEI